MANLNTVEYAADFIRGWPNGEAVEMNYPSAGGAAFGNGDLVVIGPAGGEYAAAAVGALYPVTIARGANDTFNEGGTGRGNLFNTVVPNIGIMSNYVVRTNNVFAGATVADGAPLTVADIGQPIGVGLLDGAPVWSSTSATNVVAAPKTILLALQEGVTYPDGSVGQVAEILVG